MALMAGTQARCGGGCLRREGGTDRWREGGIAEVEGREGEGGVAADDEYGQGYCR